MLFYIATPYTKYATGIDAAFVDACKAAAGIARKHRLNVLSPIAHGHPLAIYGGIDPLDNAFWTALDDALMVRCDEMLVVHMPGWDQSNGVLHEMEVFTQLGKPIRHVSWPELEFIKEN